jgi:predicted esterase
MINKIFTSNSTKMQSLIYFPSAQQNDGRFILYLHGSGGFGTGLAGLYTYSDFPSLLRDGMELTSTILIPSCHTGDSWNPSDVSIFLDDFENAHGLTDIRYDIIGYSRGGRGAYTFAANYPNHVRSIAAVSSRSALNTIEGIAEKPVLICHGTNDERIPVSEAQLMYDKLIQVNCKCALMLVEGDHYIIEKVLLEGLIFNWFKNQVN